MAQRVNVVLVDDIDGQEAVETVTFGLDGVQYEIDLSESNAAKLRETFSMYVGHGRRTGGRRGSAAVAKPANGKRARGGDEGPTAAEVRIWARENGWEVPDRGRVSADVRAAYDAAH